MDLFVKMEDGALDLIASCFISNDLFRVHNWGNVRLVATLTDDVALVDDAGKSVMNMGTLRMKEAGVTSTLSSGSELRRARTFMDRVGVNTQARPFSSAT